MALLRVNPTRMELSRLKKRLKVAVRGHKLLKDKRDEMVRRFIMLIRRNKELRDEVEAELTRALKNFVLARAVMSDQVAVEAVQYPAREVELELGKRNIMSVDVPVIKIKETADSASGSLYPYSFATTSGELDEAIATLVRLLPKLIELAEIEKTCNRLADEIEKTRRRVNALEYVMIPQFEETIRTITMKLEENERGSLTRLMKMKDMLASREA
jgi:V/A-type H+-transporting ATPase subunit D